MAEECIRSNPPYVAASDDKLRRGFRDRNFERNLTENWQRMSIGYPSRRRGNVARMNRALRSPDDHSGPRLTEHARVRLLTALSDHQLPAGARGTVVHLYRGGSLEVEFGAAGRLPTVVTVDADSVEPVAD